jgi:hypothetical protein
MVHSERLQSKPFVNPNRSLRLAIERCHSVTFFVATRWNITAETEGPFFRSGATGQGTVRQTALAFTKGSARNSVMSDNVIKFQRPKQPKPPRQTPAWLKRVLTVVVVIAGFAAVYIYFSLTGGAPQP